MSIPACDRDVFERGLGVCTFHAPSEKTEAWVKNVAKASGQRVDWHYSGGMVNVLYLGDEDAVRAAVEALRGDLGEVERFRMFPSGSRGLYRAR